MTIAHFKQQVANAVNRPLATLTSDNSEDMILAAMNDARRAAQMAHNFELNRTEDAYLVTAASGANWQTGCKTTPSGATAILMKRIDEVWTYATSVTTGTGGATYYQRDSRVDYSPSSRFKRERPESDTNQLIVTIQQQTLAQFAYAIGPKLYVTTQNVMSPYKLVGIQWLDDLAGTEDTDIFMVYFTHWFRYATIAALNLYLKDGERFPIDQTVLDGLWAQVKTMDGDIANMSEGIADLS